MLKDEIFRYLCTKDQRNPLFQDVYGCDDDIPEARKDCACDNCFYGRDTIAIELLKTEADLTNAVLLFELEKKRADKMQAVVDAARLAYENDNINFLADYFEPPKENV